MPRKRILSGGLAGLACALSCHSPRADASPYRVHAGDAIEIAVAGLPDLRMRGAVQPDGAIVFPLLGALPVAGLSPEDMRSAVQKRLSQKVFRQRAQDGREILVVIQADEVSAALVEYRPIYVNGDVARPGELPFRPDMTVRQAVALAGGMDVAALRTQHPAIDAANARAEADALAADCAKALARAARLGAELDGKEASALELPDLGLAAEEAARIRQSEAEMMQARLTDYRRERDFLRLAIAQLGERTAVLEKQQREEEEGAKSDNEDLRRMIGLLSQGNVANTRVLEARRALLMSQTRSLQVQDGLLQIKKQGSELARQLQHFEDERRETLLKERQEANAAAEDLKVKRDAAREKLDLLSLARSHLSVDGAGAEVAITRETRDGSNRQTVNGDFTLEPGDVVEVAVKAPR